MDMFDVFGIKTMIKPINYSIFYCLRVSIMDFFKELYGTILELSIFEIFVVEQITLKNTPTTNLDPGTLSIGRR